MTRYTGQERRGTQEEPKRKFRFDPTINLGNVIAMALFLLAALTQWNVMDKRVLVLEEFKLSQRERDATQDAAAKDKFQEVRDALTELRRSVEKVGEQVGVKK